MVAVTRGQDGRIAEPNGKTVQYINIHTFTHRVFEN